MTLPSTFNRTFISLLTLLSFIAMSLSGIAAFIVPEGKIAFWTHWSFLGLSKSEWGNIHITTSVLFLIAGIWHTCYNWNLLMQYLQGVPGRVRAGGKEFGIAVLVTVFFTVGAVTKTPPLNYILNFNSWIKSSWVSSPADEPPFGHAELLTLQGFCKKMDIDPGAALQELRQAGLKVKSGNETIESIARQNARTPAQVYALFKKLEPPKIPAAATTLYTADLVIERFEGKGIGRKRLSEICTELQLDYAAMSKKLEQKGQNLKTDETLKDGATRLGVNPIELLTTILENEPVSSQAGRE